MKIKNLGIDMRRVLIKEEKITKRELER